MRGCLTLAVTSFLAGAATGSVLFFAWGMITSAGFVLLSMVWEEIYG